MRTTYNLLTPAEVRHRWPEVRAQLDRAVAHGRGELVVDDILGMVEDGRMGVLALQNEGELVAVTAFEVLRYPQRKVLNFAFTGGRDAKGIVEHFDRVEEIAHEMGADAVICQCRPAVARFIKRLLPDTEQAYVVVERKVAR